MTGNLQIPTGTVTLLFTDIEGSTRLWEAEPDAMAVALRRHDEILRGAIESSGGYVFKTVGDAFCAAFAAAGKALQAVLAAQRELTAQQWPTSRPVRVRMGLHTGVCEERDADYFGPVVNRAARLEAVAHGGQVLISAATAELLSGALASSEVESGTALRDLGLHRLKDLGRPEQIFQLEAEFLQATFPELASLDNPELPNNLPAMLSAFVGRETELAAVREQIRQARLLTLTGAGGSGKTRLALQAAAELIGTPGGVWLAELAPLTDGGQVAGTMAAVLGITDHGGSSATSAIVQALAGQDSVIVLDNCEHLIDAAAKFCDEVIRHCPKVRFLATSREPLGIDGERVYRVPSMSLPERNAETAGELAASDAVLLFVERAQRHKPSFVLDDPSVPLVATICLRLDGIPLALELAAARLSSMSLAQIAGRLDQRFRLLTGGSRNAMPRQQTLQATVDWSFGLLHPAERDTLTRLSVFSGGFDLEAAEAICTSTTVDALDVLDLLGSLVDKSLVVADHTRDSVRYRLLETVRQYSAQELLRAAGDDGVLQVRERHADYYLELARIGAPATTGHGQAEWLSRLDTEWDNLRAAFAHLAADERADDICLLADYLRRFSISRGHADVLDYLRPVVDRPDTRPTAALAEGLSVAGQLLGLLSRTEPGQLAVARQLGERALIMAREVGDRRAEAHALSKLIESAYVDGDLAAGYRLAEESVAIARELGDKSLLAEQLQGLGSCCTDEAERRRIRLEGLACARETGDDMLAAAELNHLFSMNLHEGRIEEGAAEVEEAYALSQKFGGELFQHFLRANLALLRLIQDRQEEAVPLIRGCLLASRRLGPGVGFFNEMLFAAACVATWQGDYERAAILHGAGDADIDASLQMRVINWSAAEQTLRETDQGKLRQHLGDVAYDVAYRTGAALSRNAALELALSRSGQP